MRAGICVNAELQYVGLPFPIGTKVTLSQGFMATFTHNGSSRYAVDFPAAVGSTLVAARGGTVVSVKQDSNTGCADETCANDGNAIYIDHGDGTKAVYGHLQYQGAKVKVGQAVCKGQEIGLSGNTGYSSGPHLHFDVSSLQGETLPLVFDELSASDGVPFVGPTYVSQNSATTCPLKPTFSSCPGDLYKHYGVVLDSGFPCSAVKLDQVYTLSGKVLDATLDVLVAVYNPVAKKWIYTCVQPKADGTFTTQISWISSTFAKATYSRFVVVAANSGCMKFSSVDSPVKVIFL
jgi:Peptidase family M23